MAATERLLDVERLALTAVVPMYDEEAVIGPLFERLRPVLDGLDTPYELVCVDDGSTDRTAALLLAARESWPQLRVVRLVRNAGHQAALTAGFEAARGDLVVTLDADLQDPPEVIPEMVAAAESVDVVYGVRSDRSLDTWFKRVTSRVYYRTMRSVAGPQVPADAGDFRLVTRRVVDAMSHLPEPGRVHRLVIPWFGFPSAQVTYVRERRVAGTTKYPLSRMIALAVESVVAFSSAPLRVATWAGFLGVLIAIFALAWSLLGWLTGEAVPGWTSILATSGFIGAVQLICLGLLGEYVARIFTVIQRRPTFLVGYDSLRDPLGNRPRDRA